MNLHLNYIGSKKSLLDVLNTVFQDYVTADTIFVDMFAGTGSVGQMVHTTYHCPVISNDSQFYSYIINRALLTRYTPADVRAIGEKIAEYNELPGVCGFICENYAPPQRMYFTRDNAARIDAIRQALERDRQALGERVYGYLLASLLTSADRVANTSSVYAAYLKQFKESALRPLMLPNYTPNRVSLRTNVVHNKDAVALATLLSGTPRTMRQVVYMDPPYNTRQYSTYYHILETIALYDSPAIHGTTGMRDGLLKSAFSSKAEAEAAFASLFAALRDADVLVMSYNDEGIVPIERLKEMMETARPDSTTELKKIPYKKFKAQQGVTRKMLFEFLLVSEKIPADE